MSTSLRIPALLMVTALFPAGMATARPVNLDRTMFVTPGANPVASGNRLRAALADITTATATNPWLLKIEPGVYDLAGRSLALKPYVDVEGSGEGVTTIRSTVESDGTVRGAANAELRRLTVVNTAATRAMALENSAAGFRVSHVTAVARGGSETSVGFANFAEVGVFSDMTVRAEGSANSTGIATDGGVLQRARVFSSASAFAYGVFSAASTGEILDVTATAVGASYATAFRNEGGGPLLRNVRASGTGGSIGEGIVNGAGSAARIRGAVIEAVGGTSFGGGIRNESSSASVADATITVSAPGSAFGVSSSFSGTPSLENVTIRVTAAGNGIGIQADDVQLTVEGSRISADGFSLRNTGGPATSIGAGATRLSGAVQAGAGTLRCAASYDGSFVPLGPACLP